MPRMVLMCGLAGAGKSTYARDLEQRGWLRLSIDRDAWDRGYTAAADIPPAVAAEIRARQRVAIGHALDAGRDVVVDYAFWSRAQRDDYRALGRTHGADVEVVHVDAPQPVLRRRLARRRGGHADDFVVTGELLAGYVAGFEPPGPDEHDVTTVTTAE